MGGTVSFHERINSAKRINPAKSHVFLTGAKEPNTPGSRRDLQVSISSHKGYDDGIPQVPFSPAIRTERSYQAFDLDVPSPGGRSMGAGPSPGGQSMVSNVSGAATARLQAADW